MEYTVFYPTPLNEIDPHNHNIDVCVTLADGRCFTFVAATPENLKSLMEKDGVPYLIPGLPFLIVKELNDQNIRGVIEELIRYDMEWDDTLLRIYGSSLTDLRSLGRQQHSSNP